ncbi:unnamed protein product [Ceratitis capitata]|uniref:(Mediterranean fruit fly) hypothetical protein n=1 Tax=Ceratitis capitata TaxID=7213 RepID=A0A811TZT6_CERCA|nr:unnamed protein product [Ceratitis capitata]
MLTRSFKSFKVIQFQKSAANNNKFNEFKYPVETLCGTLMSSFWLLLNTAERQKLKLLPIDKMK